MQERPALRIAVVEKLPPLELPDVQLTAKTRQQIVIVIGRDRQRMAGNRGELVAGGRQIAAGKGRMLQPCPLVAGDRSGDLRRPALGDIQRQADIALRAAHCQTAHQSIGIRQRLLMFKGKAKHRAEEHHPVVAAVCLHPQRQMVDTEVIFAHRQTVAQEKIALVDRLSGVDQIDQAAVRGADRRDRRLVRPGVALPGGIPQRAGASDNRRTAVDPQRHRTERYPMALIKVIGPAEADG